jgi:hypothetical protein
LSIAALVLVKMNSNFNCSYMARSSLAYVRGFCLKFFFQPIDTDYANLAYFDKRSHLNLFLWNRFEKKSIFSNGGHLGYRTALTDTILKGTHPGTIPARFGLIWFSGFRGKDLNVIFYQNMPNLFKKNLLLWNYWANLNQTLLKWFLGGPLPNLCPAFQNSDQDGHPHSGLK